MEKAISLSPALRDQLHVGFPCGLVGLANSAIDATVPTPKPLSTRQEKEKYTKGTRNENKNILFLMGAPIKQHHLAPCSSTSCDKADISTSLRRPRVESLLLFISPLSHPHPPRASTPARTRTPTAEIDRRSNARAHTDRPS